MYRIEKTKGKKERLVYIPAKIIRELKKHNWKPNQTNRFNFYQFLKRVKRELNIPPQVELTPHTLRRAFATYHAENGLPLPLLQKLLGHASIRTTALYWMNVYQNGDDDTSDVLIAKNWPQKPKKPPIETSSVKISLEPLPELFIPSPVVSEPPANHSTKIKDLKKQLSQFQEENNNLKSELEHSQEQNENLQQSFNYSSQAKVQETAEKNQIQQELTQAKEIIHQLTQQLVQERKNHAIVESSLTQQKQINHNLHQQLQTEKEINTNLTAELNHQQQNHTQLLNTYQNLIQKQQATEISVQNEKQNAFIQKQRADYYKKQLKIIARGICQWRKINYYQQLEQQQTKIETQIIQPPPWKVKN